jgi:anti-anti-sigma factor
VSELAKVETSERDGVVVATVTGELDVSIAEASGRRIAESVPNSAHGLVVDFSGLRFIDSSGVAMMFTLARRLRSRRQKLRCVAPPGSPVARVLEIVEFQKAAPVDTDLEQSLAALAGA